MAREADGLPQSPAGAGNPALIFLSVGTFIQGFDALVEAADHAAAALGLAGLAQIGHSRLIPAHLAWERFMPEAALRTRLAEAEIVVCHGGMGILGEAMRAGKPVIAVPRRGATTAGHPANDQAPFLDRLAQVYPIRVCPTPDGLTEALRAALAAGLAPLDYGLGSDVPALIRSFLASGKA